MTDNLLQDHNSITQEQYEQQVKSFIGSRMNARSDWS